VDVITGKGEHLLEWFLHLHPDVTATVLARGVDLSLDGRPLATVLLPFGAPAAVSRGSWHPGFGEAVGTTFIEVALRATIPFEFHATIRWL
jgi:hypothetical protein